MRAVSYAGWSRCRRFLSWGRTLSPAGHHSDAGRAPLGVGGPLCGTAPRPLLADFHSALAPWAAHLTYGEGQGDALPDQSMLLRLGSEQGSQVHVAADCGPRLCGAAASGHGGSCFRCP